MGFGELCSTSTSTMTSLLWILVIPSVFCGGWGITKMASWRIPLAC